MHLCAVSLDVLPLAAAAALFRQAAGPGRAGDGALAEQIARQCGGLPLALRMAAALLRQHPAWGLSDLVAQLGALPPGLAQLSDGERDLGTVVGLSLGALTGDARVLFRQLGRLSGRDADARTAAGLLATDPAQAGRLLQELADHSLLTEPEPGRYRMNSLIHGRARARARGSQR